MARTKLSRVAVALAALLACRTAGAQYLGTPPAETPSEEQSPPAARPAPPVEPTVRRVRIWGNLGATWAYGATYVSVGAGAGYLLDPGFLPSLDVAFSFGAEPVVLQLKPGLDWFPPVPGRMRPYVGAYYAHWFVSGGYLPQDAWGVRGGLSLAQGGPAMLLVGVAYERVFSGCTGTCGYLIPQLAVGFAL